MAQYTEAGTHLRPLQPITEFNLSATREQGSTGMKASRREMLNGGENGVHLPLVGITEPDRRGDRAKLPNSLLSVTHRKSKWLAEPNTAIEQDPKIQNFPVTPVETRRQ